VAYHPLTKDSGSDADNRRAEADRILKMLTPHFEELAPNEKQFVGDVKRGFPVTVKQLFWLRDLKDKVL
jgi:hypothetical protein